MVKINKHYQEINASYLFSTVAAKVAAFTKANPDRAVIRMGIGDVTQPLCPSVITALHGGVEDMGSADTFRGYGPEQGYDFLHEAVRDYYLRRHVALDTTEIFISDGAKSDLGNLLDLFAVENTVLVPDPVYPVYVDTNIMAGRKVIYADANEHNGFLPLPDPTVKADIIYLCSPNNPTGAVYNKEQLQAWVDYAVDNGSVILFDAAYESFIVDDTLPHSIYEIDGARRCAIEVCSLSKTAGFTGTRCGYTIVPHDLTFDGMELNKMWLRRQTTKFNGVPYFVQRAAAAVFSPEGQKQTGETLAYYRRNAAVMTAAFDAMGIWYTGGKNSPYVWFKCPDNMDSWAFFDRLLEQAGVVGTPGCGFGRNGEGFFRLTAFGNYEKTQEAMTRIQTLLQ